MSFHQRIIALFGYIMLSYSQLISIQNDFISLSFNPTLNNFVSLIDKNSNIDLIGNPASLPTDLFEITLVDAYGEVYPSDLPSPSVTVQRSGNRQDMLINWNEVEVLTSNNSLSLTIELLVSLNDDSTLTSWDFSLTPLSVDAIGIWVVKFNLHVDANAATSNGQLFFPTGFGYLYNNPLKTAPSGVSELYPSGSAAFQYMALGNAKYPCAAYMAAEDSTGSPKSFQYSTLFSQAAKQKIMTNTLSSYPESLRTNALPRWKQNSVFSAMSVLTITAYPANAGVPLKQGSSWRLPYRLSVGVITNISEDFGRPMWYESAMLYRSWAIKQAEWTSQGPLLKRSRSLPKWYTENNIWINTHWQCHDIFNETGGDPSFVGPNTLAIAQRFNQSSLSLHWYEWQQGPDPSPSARYLFDTHYPDYFPSRDDFATVVSSLQDSNIHVFPYINGRIFDINSDSFVNDDGSKYCSKLSPPKLIDNLTDLESELVSYEETYGSNATFCVSSPYTDYWQQKLSDVVETLVDDYNVDGVYIDQIGAASPKLCWDARHRHTLGGGDYWRQGYLRMMNAIVKAVDNPINHEFKSPMVTEDNSEFAMDMVQGYLTLAAFRGALAQSLSGETVSYKRAVNAFPAIYGGYYVGFGAEWFRADFEDHDWFCGKLSAHFVSGSQLGWFSLVGMDNDTSDHCGPMGVGDLLLSSDSDDLISFLQLLASARGHVSKYFMNGRLARPPILTPEPSARLQTVASGGRPLLDYDEIARASWISFEDASVLLIFVSTPADFNFETKLTIDMSLWTSSPTYGDARYKIESVDPNSGERSLRCVFTGSNYSMPLIIVGRSITLLVISGF